LGSVKTLFSYLIGQASIRLTPLPQGEFIDVIINLDPTAIMARPKKLGRPSKNPRRDTQIKAALQSLQAEIGSHTQVTVNMIRVRMKNGFSVCSKTIRRSMKKQGIKYTKCKKVPKITKDQAKKRLEFAKKWGRRRASFWEKKCFWLDAHFVKKVNSLRVRDLLRSQAKQGQLILPGASKEERMELLQKNSHKMKGNLGSCPIDILVAGSGKPLRVWRSRVKFAPPRKSKKGKKGKKENEKDDKKKKEKGDKEKGGKDEKKKGYQFETEDALALFKECLGHLGKGQYVVLDNESTYTAALELLSKKERGRFLSLPAQSPDLNVLDFQVRLSLWCGGNFEIVWGKFDRELYAFAIMIFRGSRPPNLQISPLTHSEIAFDAGKQGDRSGRPRPFLAIASEDWARFAHRLPQVFRQGETGVCLVGEISRVGPECAGIPARTFGQVEKGGWLQFRKSHPLIFQKSTALYQVAFIK
jgi:hypothetical protein